MNRIVGVSCVFGLAASLSIGAASAQVVPPAPPKTPAAPEYTPPPPPPTPANPTPVRAPAAAEPEAPLGSIVARDEAGKVKPLEIPAEEAAVRTLTFTPPAKEKLEKSLAARREVVDRVVVEHLADLLAVRKSTTEATEDTSIDQMRDTTAKTTPFRANNLLDWLLKDGVITPTQKTQATKIVREYKTAVREDALKQSGGHQNMQAMALIGFRLTVDDFCGESLRELDRMVAQSAPKAEKLFAGLSLQPNHPAQKRMGELKNPPAGKTPADVARSLFDLLSTPDQQAYLYAAYPSLRPADVAPAAPDAGSAGKK